MFFIIFFGLLTLMTIAEIDCNNRAWYWNDKGFFIDTWEYNIECNYPPIK